MTVDKYNISDIPKGMSFFVIIRIVLFRKGRKNIYKKYNKIFTIWILSLFASIVSFFLFCFAFFFLTELAYGLLMFIFIISVLLFMASKISTYISGFRLMILFPKDQLATFVFSATVFTIITDAIIIWFFVNALQSCG